jgi:hypothetical protein
MSASGTDNPPEFKHAADMEWEMGRFGNVTKFLFHPRPERPTGDARDPSMPMSALLHDNPDLCLPLSEIPGVIIRLSSVSQGSA